MSKRFYRSATLWLAGVLVTAPAGALAQECQGLRWDRGGVLLGTYAATETLVIAVRHDEWWPGRSQGLHLIWDGSESGGQNHMLHATLAHGISEIAGRAWRWACAPAELAGWLGAAVAFAAVMPKEIGDGFQEYFGFSVLSTLWTAGGAVVPALRNSSWKPARALVWKVNYWPSAEYRHRTGSLPRIENDYAGQRYFLAVNPGLAQDPSGDWLPWVGFALGHSVTQWVEGEPTNQWYLTLDVNLRGIPVKASWWPQLATVLDHIHFPLPGLRLQGGRLRFGLY